MTVWVLFVWLTATYPSSYTFKTQAECEEAKETYKRAHCVKVQVPK
jgi:hypothetical protein